MESKVMQVFYGSDCLPYKDSARSVHYPIVGNSFIGASNTTQIRFYVRDIGGVNNVSWVAISKLPNGKIGSQVLSGIHLDSELNEYYVALDLSSYYTQLKGDVYISLNGYQGGVQVEEDEDTGIYTIVGTPIIEATGSIKLAINYAPQLPLGQHFNISDLQQVLGFISEKANVVNTVQVVADISLEDLSGYDNGQLFYDLTTRKYYKYNSSTGFAYYYEDVGVLANDNLLCRVNFDDDLYSYQTFQDLFEIFDEKAFIINYTGVDYLCQFVERSYIEFRAINLLTLESRYVVFNETTLDINDDFNDIFNYDITIDDFLHIKNYKDYAVPYTGATDDVTLGDHFIETKGVEIASSTKHALGGLREYAPLESDNYDLFLGASWGKLILSGDYGVYYGGETANDEVATHKFVNDIVETFKANAFILVNTTTYPTLNDFLASTGEEGYIYLYPSTNEEEEYLKYIWEENSWLFIGTTQIDLSDYYTKTQADTLLNGKVSKKTTSGIFIYGHISSTEQEFPLSSNPTNNTVPIRDGSGNIKVGTPSNNNDATPKTYVDTLGNTKVDKTSSAEKVYGTSELGEQMTYSVDSDLVGSGAIVRRETSTGTVVVGTPTSNTHATTKGYVDNAISNAISNVYKIKGSATVSQINAMTNQQVGDVYNLTDSGTINSGSLQVFTGDNIVWTGSAWDKLGAEIDWTAYDEKFIAAGFFEVQPYNENTGEITFVYSTELYIMSYDSDTGIMTIQAN